MEYRDNEVVFGFGSSGGFLLVGGQYVIQSHSVTDGQDPEGRIRDGSTVDFGSNGSLVFQVGRKGSSVVADWFNTRVPAGSTTFDHSAGDLNFAFMGQLTLTITGGSLGGGQATLVFEDVAIAQGHSGSSNNWWFGGPHCAYVGSNTVNTTAVWNGGRIVAPQISFSRGGNGVNVIDVTAVRLIDVVRWMKSLDDTKAVDDVVMPGSHDSGMSDLSHCAPPIFSEPYTQTQYGGIGQQLEAGARYFDIRVDYDYDALVTYHRTDRWGCNGQDLVGLLDQVQAFLQGNPSEAAILKISHIRDYPDHDPSQTKARINALLENYSAMMFRGDDAATDIGKTQLGRLRGKAVFVFDYDDFIDPASGRFRYRDFDAGGDANLVVFDQYSDTDDFTAMSNDQMAKWGEHGGFGQNWLFLLSWTLTSSPPGPSLQALAGIANGKLAAALFDGIKTRGLSPPNIVYLDYVDAGLSQTAVIYNFI